MPNTRDFEEEENARLRALALTLLSPRAVIGGTGTLTQTELASEMHYPQPSLSVFVNGTRGISRRPAERLCALKGMSLAEALGGAQEGPSTVRMGVETTDRDTVAAALHARGRVGLAAALRQRQPSERSGVAAWRAYAEELDEQLGRPDVDPRPAAARKSEAPASSTLVPDRTGARRRAV